MLREEFFSPSAVNIDNLNALSREHSVVFERRICEISEISDEAAELCTELYESGLSIYEILGFISDGMRFSSSEPHGDAMPSNFQVIQKHLSALSFQDMACFSSLLTERLRNNGISVSESDFLRQSNGNSSFIYVKNRLADEAYDVFSADLPDATVSYAETLRAAAEAVADGRKEYAILPLEERGGARLASIASLLYKYDLKIASVTPVFGFDGSADVKYAMVSKSFKVPEILEDDDRYLEIRLRQDGISSLSSLFLAAEILGASVYRINTVSFDTEEGQIAHFTVVFKDEGRDFSELLVFLTMFSCSYTAIGIYKNLE